MNRFKCPTILTCFFLALPFTRLPAISEAELVRLYNSVPTLEVSGECCFFQKYEIKQSGASWTIPSRNNGKASLILDAANGFLRITDDFVAGAGGHVEQEIAIFSANNDLYLAYVVRSKGDGNRYRYSMHRIKNGKFEPLYESPFPAVSVFDYLRQPLPFPAYKIMPWNAPIDLRLPRIGTTISMCIDFDTVIFAAGHGDAKDLPFVKSIGQNLQSQCLLFQWDSRNASFVEKDRTPASKPRP